MNPNLNAPLIVISVVSGLEHLHYAIKRVFDWHVFHNVTYVFEIPPIMIAASAMKHDSYWVAF